MLTGRGGPRRGLFGTCRLARRFRLLPLTVGRPRTTSRTLRLWMRRWRWHLVASRAALLDRTSKLLGELVVIVALLLGRLVRLELRRKLEITLSVTRNHPVHLLLLIPLNNFHIIA